MEPRNKRPTDNEHGSDRFKNLTVEQMDELYRQRKKKHLGPPTDEQDGGNAPANGKKHE